MKHLYILGLAILISVNGFAQIETPVKWSYAAKKISSTEAIIFVKATVNNGWHIYSINQKEGGPIKTSITFSPSKDYAVNGKLTEPAPIAKFEKVFNMDVKYFEKSVIFQQKIKLKKAQAVIKGNLEFMACNNLKCLPPEDLNFTVAIK